ncbi:MAG: DNA/RNA non-specific endonuclease [Niastella sp.]|nr:DNA/RNA non-specific endonuclease [Niastella sp.]
MPDIRKLAFDLNTLLACQGFNELFVSAGTPLRLSRILDSADEGLLPQVQGDNKGRLKYTNLTVLYNSERRVPFVSAYNIDGGLKVSGVRRAAGFKPDHRIDLDIQLSEEGFYDLITESTEFEIGHMAANNEMAWGEVAQLQSYQTFHFPNSVPQAERLNTGIWKTLETYIIDESATIPGHQQISVFSGPVLRSDDPPYKADNSFQVPLLFYKVIVFAAPSGIYSTAFIMSHEAKLRKDRLLVGVGPLGAAAPEVFGDFKYKKVFQVNISLLEEISGLDFSFPRVKKIKVPGDRNQIKAIRQIENAADATERERVLRNGEIPVNAIAMGHVATRDIQEKNFKLNIILP